MHQSQFEMPHILTIPYPLCAPHGFPCGPYATNVFEPFRLFTDDYSCRFIPNGISMLLLSHTSQRSNLVACSSDGCQCVRDHHHSSLFSTGVALLRVNTMTAIYCVIAISMKVLTRTHPYLEAQRFLDIPTLLPLFTLYHYFFLSISLSLHPPIHSFIPPQPIKKNPILT